jgi:T5SS/PEP-CTERM-associated repeat protein
VKPRPFQRHAVRAVIGILAVALGLTFAPAARSQFTANFQTNIISAVTNNWSGDYYVGNTKFADVLLIQNGGVLFNGNGFLGYAPSSSNNSVLITGSGSVWSNSFDLSVGLSGVGNSLVICNGGQAFNGNCTIGQDSASSNNTVAITGSNSVWMNYGTVYVGYSGSGNRLVISGGSQVSSGTGSVGEQQVASNNTLVVTGPGSVWNPGVLAIGSSGVSNALVLADGGKVVTDYAYAAYDFAASRNRLLITGSNSVWSNSSDFFIGFNGPGNSLVVSNGGRMVTHTSYLGADPNSSNNSVVVTGAGSIWSNAVLFLGGFSAGNSLTISDGGQVFDDGCDVGCPTLVTGPDSVWYNNGYLNVGVSLVISNGGRVVDNYGSLSTNVLVIGVGSVWTNAGPLYIEGGNTILTVSDGGQVDTGPDSLPSLCLCGSGTSLVISNGGQVFAGTTYLGGWDNGNSAQVVDGVWQNRELLIGYSNTSGNSLLVAGGTVLATNLVVGDDTPPPTPEILSALDDTGCDNLLQLDSGSVIATNATHDAVLEVRRGKLILNGGTLQVDRFVMTNACAQFVRTGGTFIYGVAVLDPNLDADGDGIPNGWEQSHGLDPLNAADANVDSDGDGFSNLQEYLAGTDPHDSGSALRITAIEQKGDDMRVTWTTGPGTTNALQVTTGGADGSYCANDFADIFTVTNTVGTSTNYLDLGAATNFPARYYRIRLVL